MQILTSGSFVNLDNQEKVDQLIFTAKAIAESAIETDGFQSDEENNKRLALEIWQGAEYMTREHERGRIQNLFVEKFLERLCEIAPAVPAVNVLLLENVESASENASVESKDRNDEFLGYITGAEENETQEVAVENDTFAEDAAATEQVEILPEINEQAASFQIENSEQETAKAFEDLTSETVEDQTVETENDKAVETNKEIENSNDEVSQIIKAGKPVINAITLPEKEPYRWDDCTVTATIQLLPVETEIRRAIISVRTHDFAPHISVVELIGAAASTPENLAPALKKAFERYQTDLPVKVMDKMKREKSAGKKHQTKTAFAAKTDSPVSNQTAGSQLKPEPPQRSIAKTESNQTASSADSQTVSAQPQSIMATRSKTNFKTSKPEDNKQGNLFGF
jgi:hypothetical protein